MGLVLLFRASASVTSIAVPTNWTKSPETLNTGWPTAWIHRTVPSGRTTR